MKKVLIFLIILLLFISGCGSLSVDQEALTLIDHFYGNIRFGNYEDNSQYFSQDYWSVTTMEETLKLFNIVHENVGDLQTYELSNQGVSQITGGTKKPAGKYIRLTYLVHWSNGTTTDSFVLFRPNGGSYRIDSYHTEIKIPLE